MRTLSRSHAVPSGRRVSISRRSRDGNHGSRAIRPEIATVAMPDRGVSQGQSRFTRAGDDKIDSEKQTEDINAIDRPMRQDQQAEQQRDDAGYRHPRSRVFRASC